MKNIYKFSAIAVISTILILSIFLSTKTVNDLPSADKVEQTFSESQNLPKTNFPKLALSSPFGNSGYIQSVCGSNSENCRALFCLYDNNFMVGESTSSDYDFANLSGVVFIAKSNEVGTLEKVVKIENSLSYLHSTIGFDGILALTNCDSFCTLVHFDLSLEKTKSITLPTLEKGRILVCKEGVYVLGSQNNATKLFFISEDFNQSKTLSLFEKPLDCLDFSEINDSLIALLTSKEQNETILLKAQKNSTSFESTRFSNATALDGIPALFSGDIGYAFLYKNGEEIKFKGVCLSGKKQWDTLFSTGEEGKILRLPSNRYIAFTKNERTSHSTLFCQHGDILEKNFYSLEGFTPVEYLYSKEGLLALFESNDTKKGALLLFDENDAPVNLFNFDSCNVNSFVLNSDGSISVGVTSSSRSSPFGSGRGESSSFIMNFIPRIQ